MLPLLLLLLIFCCAISMQAFKPTTTINGIDRSRTRKHPSLSPKCDGARYMLSSRNDIQVDSRTWIQRPSPRDNNRTTNNENIVVINNVHGRRKQKLKPMPVTGYDAAAIEAYYDRRPWEVVWRLNNLGIPLLGWYLGLLTDKTMGIADQEEVQRKRGVELRMHLVQSKSVALIKSGQALSLRPDLIRNKIWAEELGRLVDAVGSFPDLEAMKIMKKELSDLNFRLEAMKTTWKVNAQARKWKKSKNRLQNFVESDNVLSLFEFMNDNRAVASASIGQVYKARIRGGPQLEAAIGTTEAQKWGGKVVAIKVQRPDVEASASLDMYLLRRTATWLSRMRGGDLPKVADAFGMQLFGELGK